LPGLKTAAMKNEPKLKIFMVDDDALFLKSLEIEMLQHTEYSVETFPTGELCMINLSHHPNIIILDYHLDGINKNAMNGIETLDKIKAQEPGIPVVILSCEDKIDAAVNRLHHNAFDYVVKKAKRLLPVYKKPSMQSYCTKRRRRTELVYGADVTPAAGIFSRHALPTSTGLHLFSNFLLRLATLYNLIANGNGNLNGTQSNVTYIRLMGSPLLIYIFEREFI
jgi:two-component system, OmpR family, response regulator